MNGFSCVCSLTRVQIWFLWKRKFTHFTRIWFLISVVFFSFFFCLCIKLIGGHKKDTQTPHENYFSPVGVCSCFSKILCSKRKTDTLYKNIFFFFCLWMSKVEFYEKEESHSSQENGFLPRCVHLCRRKVWFPYKEKPHISEVFLPMYE